MASFLISAHIMLYGYALGSTTFNSFVASIKAFELLPRREFGILQGAVLPIQFLTQAAAPPLIALTAPYALSTLGMSLLAISSTGGLLNLGWITPTCADIKQKRWSVIDSKFGGDEEAAKASGDLKDLDKAFGKYHVWSLIANFASILSITAYGFVLSGKFKPVI